VVRVRDYRSRGPGFDSQHYQIFWEVVDLERGPLSLVSTIEELLGRKSSGSGLENQECGLRGPLFWPRNTLYPQKLAPTSPTSSSRLVGIVCSRTKATGVWFFLIRLMQYCWMYLVSEDTIRFPRLHYHFRAALCVRSNGFVFFLLALSVCSAASGQFPHMMATFTLGSYTCTHLHSNANRNSLFLLKRHWDSAASIRMIL
jgi:hypothetical protein